MHEDFERAHDFQGPSDRNFGTVFTLFFLVLGLWPLKSQQPLRMWALALSGLFLAVTLLAPRILHPLNRAWLQLGLLLGKFVNPIVMAVLFYAVFTPAGIIARALGKDLLRLKKDAAGKSYWVVRQPAGPHPQTMAKQF